MKSWVFILLVSLAACSPGLEPGEPTSNPLDLFDNSDPTEEDLDDLFRNQDPSASEETQSPGDGSRPPGSEEGLEPFPPFIGDGQNPSEVQSEPPTGPAPVDMEREEAEASELTPPPASAPAPAATPTPPAGDSSAPPAPALPQEEPQPAAPVNETPSSDVSEPSSTRTEEASNELESGELATAAMIEAEEEGPLFRNPHAQSIFDRAKDRLRIPFQMSAEYGRFAERFDNFLFSQTPQIKGPKEREFFRIPRCAGTEEDPVTTHWPQWSDRMLPTRPLGLTYIPSLGNVNVYFPLHILDLKEAYESHNLDYDFPFYDVLIEAESPSSDPLLAHSVTSLEQLPFLSLATSKEIFEHSMAHVFQMTVDAKASLNLARRCAEGSGDLACEPYTQSFEIHHRAHSLQRMALALSLSEDSRRCQELQGQGFQEGQKEECFFKRELTHAPQLWQLSTYYNPLKNIARRSSDIDHWGRPQDLSQEEASALELLLTSSADAPYLQIKERAQTLYKNLTLIFPALKFVETTELTSTEYARALKKVSDEVDKLIPASTDRVFYEQLSNLKFFSLAMMSRLHEEVPVEVCDMIEEVLSDWNPKSTLDGQLALDNSFSLMPIELHKFLPPQALAYNTFTGLGWQYIAQTFYDFAEARTWSFTIQSSNPNLRVSSQEASEVAQELLRHKGLEPPEQTNQWTSGSAQELLSSLLLD